MRTPMPSVEPDEIGWLTEAQMVEVDRVMIEELQIGLIQMMENAGRNLAQLVLQRFDPSTVTVLAGSGGNGGGGLVAARHLANRGVDVSVTLGQPVEKFGPVPAQQFEILQRMGVDTATDPPRSDVVIDALIGYSLTGAPRGRVGELVAAIGDIGGRVVSLDTPSGLDVTDGSVPGLVVDADATLTLALPKVGLRDAVQVGELYLADISVPPSVYDAIGVAPAPDFSRGTVLEIATL
ncbi:MAG: NAD(P)H-hydrate epimerase [Ilumatobacter sp.]|uniref:NAD(P)H-hydrate epimerase n=1 Tax=Ilumatobacter sp. TaxID=1967498 RepID=UPI003C775E1C